jgi:hypothetical protein
VCSILVIGCGTSKTSGSDAGPQDAGLESACGQPGATGNSLGVGQYCNTADNVTCATSGTLCSDIVNNPATPQNDTFVCIVPECDPCAPPGTCGAGAQCVCSPGLGGCGCFPTTTCPGIVAVFNATTTCMDAGTPGEGPGDAGPVTDAGPAADAGSTDAGPTSDAGSASGDAGPSANCYNACISQYPTAYTAFVDTELTDCGCNSGSPCVSSCTAECANMSTYSDSSTCGMCIDNQENLGSSSACTATAGAYCLFTASAACHDFISCSNACP